ncbi:MULTISPECIES: type I polyketide synthase [Rhizobium/Agrobacterium group]|uniref:type I polyketide synthase n=1 Tax=Rhizobium/Agrobacterium group TaxID=227290 RepID=UPI000FD79AA8|nr:MULTISPECIES: type I polyketide synthase [Rhizobium/Agrobacterium group]RVT68999.1 SDR family NAD(P)-dependent oxidoreductase [Agrobacterium sp. CNPSo 2736]WHO77369.1 type I polyketide synthase [Rhizobium sp. BT03]
MNGPIHRATPIAIIGMACRFPDADTPKAFWENIIAGRESVRQLSDVELAGAGVEPEDWEADDYIRHGAPLMGLSYFDADFFGIMPREAALLDPQHRLFLESIWHAIEDAGYAVSSSEMTTGIYAGSGPNSYFARIVAGSHDFSKEGMLDTMSGFQAMLGNDKDYLATRAAHRLNLIGPAVNVQTACSTSLVSLHLACSGLHNGECDLALAGGVTAIIPDGAGYRHQEGMILSSDGHCRPFDAEASGTVFSSGVGVLALRRLDDALAEGDTIHAVIRGSAINNDGNDKISFSAPSIEGQSSVVARALMNSSLAPETISYMEMHGTGTKLGDPIEIEALSEVFAGLPADVAPITLGSVKANIGHTIAASGVAGVIKTVMALKSRTLPPAVNFKTPNPEINFDRLPFVVPASAVPWTSEGPRRAGISSFGVGGTNAHVILEEAPSETGGSSQPNDAPHHPDVPRTLNISARTPQALRAMAKNFALRLETAQPSERDAICFTANTARRAFEYRSFATGRTTRELAESLRASDYGRVDVSKHVVPAALFTGQGGQGEDMGRGLYESNPIFREAFDACDAVISRLRKHGLGEILYGDGTLAHFVHDTEYTQPALFAIELALARVFKAKGFVPKIVIGHSIGEYVAAYLAGVFSLEDGLKLITKRGELMGRLPRNGGMVALTADANTAHQMIRDAEVELAIAAENGPANTVVAGETNALETLIKVAKKEGVSTTQLKVSHAFHSHLMDPILEEFEAFASTLDFSKPDGRLISAMTGKVAGENVANARYWTEHVRQPVLFHRGMIAAEQIGANLFLEIGPHPVLTPIAQAALDGLASPSQFVSSLHRNRNDEEVLAETAGRLFLGGLTIDTLTDLPDNERRFVDLPLYPFERQHHWIDPKPSDRLAWHCRREWHVEKQSAPQPPKDQAVWFIVGNALGLAGRLAHAIEGKSEGAKQTAVVLSNIEKGLIGGVLDGYVAGIIVAHESPKGASSGQIGEAAHSHAATLTHFVQAVQTATKHCNLARAKIWVVGQAGRTVPQKDKPIPDAARPASLVSASLHGLAMVLASEQPDLWGGDIDLSADPSDAEIAAAVGIIFGGSGSETAYAVRGEERYVLRLSECSDVGTDCSVDPQKTYLITGGLGALGSLVGEWLINRGARRLALLNRDVADGAKRRRLEALRRSGAEIEAHAVDIADQAGVERILTDLSEAGHQLGGIVHTAGIVQDATLGSIEDASELERALLAKLQGTLVLDKASRRFSPDFFVCFSSVSALLGMKGQAAYVAANAAMNRIVEGRNAEGLPGVSIEWGPWAEAGMASGLDECLRKRLTDLGLLAIRNREAIERLGGLFASTGTLTAAPILWERFAKKQYGKPPAWLTPLMNVHKNPQTANNDEATDPLARLFGLVAPSERGRAIESFLRGEVAGVLGIADPDSLPMDASLNQMGFDSLATIEFRNELAKTGIKVSLQKLVMGASIAEMAADTETQVTAALRGGKAVLTAPVVVDSAQGYNKSAVIIPRPKPDAPIRLICFPYAGGGPLVFQRWIDKMPDHIELGIVQMPGRSARLAEGYWARMEDVVDGIVPEMLPYLKEKPFAFFGFCLGAVQAFEVAQRVRRDHGLEPEHFFVAGARSPQSYNDDQFAIDVQQFNHETGRAEHELNESEFVEMLKEVNFANNKALFEDPEMRAVMLPIIQADYAINNAYRYGSHPPLDAPITAVGGRIDPYVTGDQIFGWKEHTTKEFKAHFCAGDHFFMEHQLELLTSIAIEDLESVVKRLIVDDVMAP